MFVIIQIQRWDFYLNSSCSLGEKATKWMLWIYLYRSNLKTFENCVHLRKKTKDWSMKWYIHFERKWRNPHKNDSSMNYNLLLLGFQNMLSFCCSILSKSSCSSMDEFVNLFLQYHGSIYLMHSNYLFSFYSYPS